VISRDDALIFLKEHVKSETLLLHCRESELVMRALAAKLGRDVELWGLAGLLHDIDFETTKDTPAVHGIPAGDILKTRDIPAEAVTAIIRHNGENNGNPPQAELDFALRCAETITGLLIASALVRPDKKLGSVEGKSVKKKFKDKRFAANCSRDTIQECEKIGVPLDDFIECALSAVKPCAAEFGV
jgi:uncharacterized protein